MHFKLLIQIVAFGVFLAGLAIFSFGCVSYQSFSGSPLPRSQIAVLKLETARDSLGVTGIDGRMVNLYPGTSIQLLPGKHTLSFVPRFEHANFYGPAITNTVWLKAGKTYLAHANVIHLATLHGASATEWERLNAHAHDVSCRVEIVEK